MTLRRGFPTWEPLGTVDFFPPTKKLIRDYESLRKERIEEFYQTLDKKMEHPEAKEKKDLQPVVPEKSIDQLVVEAKEILPNILHKDWEWKLRKDMERDVIDMNELKKHLDLPHTLAYAVRSELFKHLKLQAEQR